MNIGVDVDNVLSKFDEALMTEFLIHDKTLRGKGVVDSTKYITQGMFDWSKSEKDDFYHKNIEKIVSDLEVVDGARYYINKLRHDGHKIFIISGRDNGEYSNPYELTKNWLDRHKIEYDGLILTNAYENCNEQKAKACLRYDVKIMIDDSIEKCQECLENGIEALLMDTPYNRNSNIQRVKNWKEIYEFVKNYKTSKINVILDTDAYNECDDQFAIAYMLKSQDKLNVRAITIAPYSHKHKCTVPEGVELSFNEVLKICKYSNLNIKDKVFKGSTDYVTNGYHETNDAVEAIINVVKKHKKTTILAIGALTNIALAIEKDPNIVKKIEIIWLGGHSVLQENNSEFNFKQDPEAARIVFDSEVKLTVIPCKNVASNLITSIYELQHHLNGKSVLCDYLLSRFTNDTYHAPQERRVIWDISVVAYVVNKNWFKSDEISCPDINKENKYIATSGKHLIKMVKDINVNKVYADLFEKLKRNK